VPGAEAADQGHAGDGSRVASIDNTWARLIAVCHLKRQSIGTRQRKDALALTVTDVQCKVGEAGSSLLLGHSFLQKFRFDSIDNNRGVLVLGSWPPRVPRPAQYSEPPDARSPACSPTVRIPECASRRVDLVPGPCGSELPVKAICKPLLWLRSAEGPAAARPSKSTHLYPILDPVYR
jgi:hypothetical protein